MNIFNKVALQGLKKNRTRTLVTIIGVVLSAAMITAVATFGVSLLSYMTNGAIAKYGDWHVEFLDVDSSFVQERTHDDGVASTATFENIGYAALDGSKTQGKPYLFLAGYSEETLDALPVTLFSGRMPENSGEILVSGKVATEAGVKFAVGDTVSLTVGSRMSGGESSVRMTRTMPRAKPLCLRVRKPTRLWVFVKDPALRKPPRRDIP